jgi:hypothetical protein
VRIRACAAHGQHACRFAGQLPLQPPFDLQTPGQKSDLSAQLPFVQTLAGNVDVPSLHLQPMGAQLFTPPFASPQGEPGGSVFDVLPELELPLDVDVLDVVDPLLDELVVFEPMPHGGSFPARAWQSLFSRHVACDSVIFIEHSSEQVAEGLSAPHCVAFASHRELQLAASGSPELDVLPLDDEPPVPVDVELHANPMDARAMSAPGRAPNPEERIILDF